MTTTLTDRYVAAVLRRVPERQRADIERELRAAIADDVDARLALGETPTDAENAVLTELGDPLRLAANYSNRTLALIGPDLYPTYIRTLRIFAALVLPTVFAVLVVVGLAERHNVWSAIFGPFGTTLSVAVYLAFFTTLAFALADRAEAGKAVSNAETWSPKQLPEIPTSQLTQLSDIVVQIVGAFVIVGLLLAQLYVSPATTESGAPIPMVAPALWPFWICYVIVLALLAIPLEVVKYRLGRWIVATAVAETVLALAGGIPLIWLVLQARIVNPAFVRAVGGGHLLGTDSLLAAGSWLWWLIAVVLAVIMVSRIVTMWRPSRSRRESPTSC